MAKWRVYYEDGSTWSWKQGTEGIPIYGVICILQEVPIHNGTDKYNILHKNPYYGMYQGEWVELAQNDLVDYAIHGKHIGGLLIGRLTTKFIYTERMYQARQDYNAENL